MGRNKEFEEDEVLKKAMELFWLQGYEKTSMSDLVEHMVKKADAGRAGEDSRAVDIERK